MKIKEIHELSSRGGERVVKVLLAFRKSCKLNEESWEQGEENENWCTTKMTGQNPRVERGAGSMSNTKKNSLWQGES